MERKLAYWQPCVMRHHKNNISEYAIHEVYFSSDDSVVAYTGDALSPRASTVDELKSVLMTQLGQPEDEFEMGDLNYSYSKEDILFWLDYIDVPPIDYGDE